MKRFVRSLIMLTVLLAVACGAPAISPESPPEIVYGEDVCDHCGMIINEERFAAGAVIDTGGGRLEQRAFDDIGDLFAYAQVLKTQAGDSQASDATPQIVTYFVHDYRSLEWVDARAAYFVAADASRTPMGSGLVAFASLEDAEAQAQSWNATVLDFDAVQQRQMEMNHGHAQK